MSFQVTLRSNACSHFIQAPCCYIATALLVRSSLTEARTSSCTSLCLSFPLAESYRVALRLPSLALPCATVPRMALCFSRDPRLLKTFHHSHGDLIDKERPEDSWEDSMLIDPGLESSREPRVVHCSQPSLQVSTGCLDGVSVIQAAVEDLSKAIYKIYTFVVLICTF